jgi:hypothetical protein
MDFNEFNRELERRISDPQLKYMLALQYQHIMAMAAQLDAMSKVVSEVVNSLQGVVGLHAATQGKVQDMARVMRGERMGEQFQSVPIGQEDPDNG